MPDKLTLLSLDSFSSRKGRETLLRLSAPLPEEQAGIWIHLPTLLRVRLKPAGPREAGEGVARIRGLARERLKKGDQFLPLSTPRVCSRSFYGRGYGKLRGARSEQRQEKGEFLRDGQRVSYTVKPSGIKGAGLLLFSFSTPLDLIPGETTSIGGSGFVPLSIFPAGRIGPDTTPFEAQGWLPSALVSGDAVREGVFSFREAWLDSVRDILNGESRLEGGLDARRLSELLHVPPYILPELLELLQRREWFRLLDGVLLDASWDYSRSLSPMSRGLLSELKEQGLVLEKITGSPRYAGFRILCRTGLALEIEEGAFIDDEYFRKIYRDVGEIRRMEPSAGLSELARRTGIKKRFLIPLLHYGDAEG
jgi:hypothetical protein